MRRILALAVIFALALGPLGDYTALAAETHNSELWHIATINDPSNKKFTYCAAESSFDNGFSLAFARNRELNTNIVITFPRPALEEHTKFRMNLLIDGAVPREFVGFSANPQTLVIPLQHDRPIVDSLQKGKLLELRGPKDAIKFALDGANDALHRLQLCVETNLKAETASAGGTPEARPLVLGGPASVDAAPKGDMVEPLPLPGAPPVVEMAQADQSKPVTEQSPASQPSSPIAPPAPAGQINPDEAKLPLDAPPLQKPAQDIAGDAAKAEAAKQAAAQAQLDAQRQATDEAAAKEALAKLEAAEAAKKAAADQAAHDAAAQQKVAQEAQAAEAAKQASIKQAAAQQAADEAAAKQKAERDAQVAAAAKAQAAKDAAAQQAAAQQAEQARQAQLDAQRQALDDAAAKEALAKLEAAEAAKKAAADQAAKDAAVQQAAVQQKAAQDAAAAETARKAAAEQAARDAMAQQVAAQQAAAQQKVAQDAALAEAARKAAAEQAAQQAAAQQKAAQDAAAAEAARKAAAEQKAAQDAAAAEAARKAAAEQAAQQAAVQAAPAPAAKAVSLGGLLDYAGVQASSVKGRANAYSWKNGTIAGSASEIPASQPFLDAMLDNIDAVERTCKGQFSSSIGAPTTRGGATYAEVATKCGAVLGVRLYYEKAGHYAMIAHESANIDRDNAVTIRQRAENALTGQ